MIRITAKRKTGIWRCGVFHPWAPTNHPDDRFSEEEMGRLVEEPMLTVEPVDGEPEPPASGPAGDVSAAELAELQKILGEEAEAQERKFSERSAALDDREAALVEKFREPILRAAIATVAAGKRPEDFTKDGRPKGEAISREAGGIEISAAERDKWFLEMAPPQGG